MHQQNLTHFICWGCWPIGAMRGGTVWGLQKKELKPTEQPNTDVWKVEKCYNNPKTLIHNWHETRAKAEVSAILGRSSDLHVIKITWRALELPYLRLCCLYLFISLINKNNRAADTATLEGGNKFFSGQIMDMRFWFSAIFGIWGGLSFTLEVSTVHSKFFVKLVDQALLISLAVITILILSHKDHRKVKLILCNACSFYYFIHMHGMGRKACWILIKVLGDC